MIADAPPWGRALEHDEHRSDLAGHPSSLARDAGSQAHLCVEPSEELLKIGDHRLDFDHEQDAGGWMKGEQVDAPAFPKEVVTRFCNGLPPVRLQQASDRFGEG